MSLPLVPTVKPEMTVATSRSEIIASAAVPDVVTVPLAMALAVATPLEPSPKAGFEKSKTTSVVVPPAVVMVIRPVGFAVPASTKSTIAFTEASLAAVERVAAIVESGLNSLKGPTYDSQIKLIPMRHDLFKGSK